jgi:hypothetical protein
MHGAKYRCMYACMQVQNVRGDRMLKWDFKGEVQCLFCRNIIECRDHLFFDCGFSKRLWREVMNKCLLPELPTGLEEMIGKGIREWRSKNLRARVCKLA